MAKIEIIETEELPKCPHCGKELDKILKKIVGFLEEHTVYLCAYCKKMLSIGYHSFK